MLSKRKTYQILRSSGVMISFFMLLFEGQAQPGTMDLTFNPTDQGYGFGDGPSASVESISIQSDGKVIIGGRFTSFNSISRSRIARINADGTLDNSFIVGTGASLDVKTTALQSDGKIIIGGHFTSYNGVARNKIARLNVDGSLDPSFVVGSGFGTLDFINTVAIQSNGKIIVGGDFSTYNGFLRNNITRLNADGSLDTTFVGTGTNDLIETITLQTNGKIIIGGRFTSYNGTAKNYIARLNSDGNLDSSFVTGAGPDNYLYTSSLQTNGKIIIGGVFNSYDGSLQNFLARLNTDGSLDTSFVNVPGANGAVFSTSLQSDGKIILGGDFTVYHNTPRKRIARLNSNGSLDITFTPGSGVDYGILETPIHTDGKIFIGGHFNSVNGTAIYHLARLNTNGTLDTSFDIIGSGINRDAVRTLSIQTDGKIIAGGFFTSFNEYVRNKILRLNTDGTLDTSFIVGTGTDGTGTAGTVTTSSIQTDGKIIIGGAFNYYNGTTRNRVARLNVNGTLDASFAGTGANNIVYTSNIQNDGKIIIGGQFTTYNGSTKIRITRLNTDGSNDPSFSSGTGPGAAVYASSIQSDGKIIIGGDFQSYNGTQVNHVCRLNVNGSLDSSFTSNAAGVSGEVHAIAIQDDGKIIIGGAFTLYNGTPINRIARVNADGTLDTSFAVGAGANHFVKAVSIQSDGKIIIAGYFTSYSGIPVNRIARLHTDGSLDSSFFSGNGANSIIETIAIQSDDRIIIGGYFTAYNGVGKNRIARIIGICSNSISSFNQTSCGSYTSPSGIYTWTSSGAYSDTLVNAGGCDSIMTINLTILPAPAVMITAQGSTTFCAGDSVMLSASPMMSTYQWYRRNDPIPGATSMDYVAKSGGKYKCIVQNTALCSDTSNSITVSIPCIPIGPHIQRISQIKESDSQFLHVFPSPSSGIFQIESSGGQLRVFSSLGKLLLSIDTYEGKSMFNISEYPDGIYFVSFVSGDSEYYQKIILSR